MKNIHIYKIALLCFLFCSCGKEFLEIKQNKNIDIPATIADYQALMDNSTALFNVASAHELGIIGSDEYDIEDAKWGALPDPYQRNAYIWAAEVYQGSALANWDNAYKRILYANVALDGLLAIKPRESQMQAYNQAKGTALFLRALNFYQIAMQFCKPYEPSTADKDPGIPLRLDSDVTKKSERTSVKAVYVQLELDLSLAIDLLPVSSSHNYRPSRVAAHALLARVYMQMDLYAEALAQCKLALELRSELVDFNTLNLNSTYTFTSDVGKSNPEVIFYTILTAPTIVNVNRMNISNDLIELYDENDLRPKVYTRTYTSGNLIFKGSYTGGLSLFTGFATDELYLNRAECYARLGEGTKAMLDLNTLLKNRIESETFEPAVADNSQEALKLVIAERRKELLFRGTRWEDLRRLNKEPAFKVTLSRTVNGAVYTLPANDQRYVWPIPPNVISLSGMQQNER